MVDSRHLCNGLDAEALRSEASLKGREREWGYWRWGIESPCHQLGGLGSNPKLSDTLTKLPQRGVWGAAPENLDFEHFGTSKITSEWSVRPSDMFFFGTAPMSRYIVNEVACV